MEKTKPGGRVWFNLILFGLMGQIAWNVENMYFNTFLCNFIYGHAGQDAISGSMSITDAVSKMVALSAATAVITTFIMGNLSDKVNNRKLFISGGYILWGIVTGCFGFISLENTQKLFGISEGAAALTATVWIVVAMDCLMTFMGSTSNDSAFNAWVTDVTDTYNRTAAETVLAVMPVAAMGIVIAGGGIIVSKVGYPMFFFLLGGVVILCGVIGLFTLKDSRSGVKNTDSHYWADLFYGFRPSVVKANSRLYLTLATICIYSVALQVFFPYIIVYLQHSDIDFMNSIPSLLTAKALIPIIIELAAVAAFIIVFVTKANKFGKEVFTVIAAVLYAGGLIAAYFAHTAVSFVLCALPLLAGYAVFGIALNAVIRDFTPEDKTGLFQGVRMIFYVLIPMVLGPRLCLIATKNSSISYINDYGAVNMLPSSLMFLVAGITALLVFIPLIILIKKGMEPYKLKD